MTAHIVETIDIVGRSFLYPGTADSRRIPGFADVLIIEQIRYVTYQYGIETTYLETIRSIDIECTGRRHFPRSKHADFLAQRQVFAIKAIIGIVVSVIYPIGSHSQLFADLEVCSQ